MWEGNGNVPLPTKFLILLLIFAITGEFFFLFCLQLFWMKLLSCNFLWQLLLHEFFFTKYFWNARVAGLGVCSVKIFSWLHSTIFLICHKSLPVSLSACISEFFFIFFCTELMITQKIWWPILPWQKVNARVAGLGEIISQISAVMPFLHAPRV